MEQQDNSKFRTVAIITVLFAAAGCVWYVYGNTVMQPVTPSPIVNVEQPLPQIQTPAVSAAVIPTPPVVTHVSTPAAVRAIYISGWTAGTASSMVRINSILDAGTVNAVVIDIKDATGRLSYMPKDPVLAESGIGTRRIARLPALIKSLHDRNIYVIGRISVFQDPYWPTVHPEDALQDTTTGTVWKDSKGLAWLRADNPKVWNYIERIAEDAYAQGFDEVNMDYVRFPTDGALRNIDYSTLTKSKQDTIADFFAYLDTTIRKESRIPLSADIFGLTVSAEDDMGIGQKIELIAPYVDYVSPMIYPSHFAASSYGFSKPAEHPYQIIHKALTDGIAKLAAVGIPAEKIRPWLQDFDLGAIYTADMVQAQIDATYDVGLKSWMMWDASNTYTLSVYK